ncbi:MAG: hypothetical protein V1867_07815 [Candidatus Falkowbacteria bacterium]
MKTKKQKRIFILFLVIAMVSAYGYFPRPDTANAINAITDAKDLMTDTDLGVTATHTFTFTTSTTTETGNFWQFSFPSEFTTVGAGAETCGINATQQALFAAASTTAQLVDCVATGDLEATSTQVTIAGVTNPVTDNPNGYTIDLTHYSAALEILERVQIKVYIISDVWVTARVDSTLNFTVTGVDALDAKTVNGIGCGGTTTSATIPFDTLVVNATSTRCQTLNVTTNADDGYTVTVWQDQELTSDSLSTINSFDNSPDNTGSTTAHVWTSPRNMLDVEYTYGHMGLTSDDQDLSSAYANQNYYNGGGTAQYAGLNSSDPLPVMHHTGPSDGTTQNMGVATVAYSIQIASLQEAGDYESTLTYVCTPTF